MERIKSGLEALTEEVTQFITAVNKNLLVPRGTKHRRWLREAERVEEIHEKMTTKGSVEHATHPHQNIYLPNLQVHWEEPRSEMKTKTEDTCISVFVRLDGNS